MIALEKSPYAFLKSMILMYQKRPEREILASLTQLKRDQLPFFKYEISQIFKQFGQNGVYNSVK